jgi:hypothetical protein
LLGLARRGCAEALSTAVEAISAAAMRTSEVRATMIILLFSSADAHGRGNVIRTTAPRPLRTSPRKRFPNRQFENHPA